ncbi:tRNA pseudouridine(55) synthase TruB [Candidatus Termititenax persephonae]|uniref:tRNA pseudouridine synthase B n=1 Tax=Candidatus Termititenax persephonae TaxID=2218525 RepID=A0A388TES3_9BACT|nr:tRNA pseudouridine(55) synthase TruB [Candidatus Termititenax persephonae]
MFFTDGIYSFHKPLGWTSYDVVGWVKRRCSTRKVGHAGTLDPAAEGLLLVAVGREYTRDIAKLTAQEKEYVCEITFGVITDTGDRAGQVLSRQIVNIDRGQLPTVLSGFVGKQKQIPPMYSAVKVRGQKLYELARQGIEVERPPREIEIKELELLEFCPPDKARLRIVCSKGTYIRTLCYNIGEKIGGGAYMSSLTRTRIGEYKLSAECIRPQGSRS